MSTFQNGAAVVHLESAINHYKLLSMVYLIDSALKQFSPYFSSSDQLIQTILLKQDKTNLYPVVHTHSTNKLNVYGLNLKLFG